MRAICIDDEELILNMTVCMCEKLPQLDEVHGFSDATEALKWLDKNSLDIALLDIDMPEINGIQMAMEIKNRYPNASIIFVTGYSEYALEAFRLHASGYLLKPISMEQLEKEIEYALFRKNTKTHSSAHIAVRTFGEFDVFVDRKRVNFSRAKSKELLAYLVEKQGEFIKKEDVFQVMWEGDSYDRAKQKQMDVIARSLYATLEEYGISDIVEKKRGAFRVIPEKIDCDLYRFLEGDVEIINRYRGEYMNSYSWASMMEGYITSSIGTD